jgi:hypothetical protein
MKKLTVTQGLAVGKHMRDLLPFLIMVLAGLLISGCTLGPKEYGTLEGQVSIGPLQPVVRVGEPEPTPNPEVYAAREIVIFKANGKTEVTRVKIDPNGKYQVELPVGTYVVDINHLGIDSAAALPQEIVITSNTVTILDIDIDTGIR